MKTSDIVKLYIKKNNKNYIIYYDNLNKKIHWNDKENFNNNLEYLNDFDKQIIQKEILNFIKKNPLYNICLN